MIVPCSCECIGKDSSVAWINALALLFGKVKPVLSFDWTQESCRSEGTKEYDWSSQ